MKRWVKFIFVVFGLILVVLLYVLVVSPLLPEDVQKIVDLVVKIVLGVLGFIAVFNEAKTSIVTRGEGSKAELNRERAGEENLNTALSKEPLFDDSSYRQWIAKITEHIDIRGIGTRRVEDPKAFRILDLYTKLYVRTDVAHADMDKSAVRGRKRIRLADMISLAKHLLILGDPGSGKTTFLRYIARKQADDLSKPLPVFIRLADLNEFAVKRDIELHPLAIVDYLVDIGTKEGLNVSREGFLKKLNDGDCTLLLDGLDELPSDKASASMVETIQAAAGRWDTCSFTITSRPTAVKGLSIPIGFEIVSIDDWGKEEIKAFLKAFIALLYPDAPKHTQQQRWGELLSTIRERQDLRNLARNAVMLTAIAVVHYNQTRLPEGKAELLEAVISWLLHARDAQPTARSEKFTEARYLELALAMLEDNEGGRTNRVGRLWAAQKISPYFEGGVEEALEFLQREESNTGMLVARGEGDLAFWHPSFQWFLAAKQTAGKTDDLDTGWWSVIEPHLDKIEWLEVLSLVPACLGKYGNDRVNLFFKRLADSCSNAPLAIKAQRAALCGRILRDLYLAGYESIDVKVWSDLLNELLPLICASDSGISLNVRYDASIACGLVGDKRFSEFEDTWIKIPKDSFLMGAQSTKTSLPNYDPDAADWEGPIVEIEVSPFEISKYPITVEEFKEFKAGGGYKEEALELWSPEGWEWRCSNDVQKPLDWESQLLAPNCPVTGISWYEVNAYCAWLTTSRDDGFIYRLPLEPEWEFAARKAIPPSQKFPWGNIASHGDEAEANFAWSGLLRKSPVGIFPSSTTDDGIVDMIGNVEEWCEDLWFPSHNRYYNSNVGSEGLASDKSRVVRGGSAIRYPRLCRPTYRSRIFPHKRYHTVGFRPVRYIIKERNTESYSF